MLYSDPAFTAEELIFGARDKDTKPADLEITDEYNVLHRVWKLTDPALINLIVTAMADKKLIIADGHHHQLRNQRHLYALHERAAALGLTTSLSSRNQADGSASPSADDAESPSNRADEPHTLLPTPAFPEAAAHDDDLRQHGSSRNHHPPHPPRRLRPVRLLAG